MPKEKLDRIVQLYEAGKTHDQISEELGVGRRSIRRWVESRGVEPRRRVVRNNPVFVRELRKLWGDPRLTTEVIAETFGVSPATIQNVVVAHGLPSRGKSPRKAEAELDEATIERIKAAFGTASTLGEIALRFDLSIHTVRALGKRHGLPPPLGAHDPAPTGSKAADFRAAWRKGETLASIAERFEVSVAAVGRWREAMGLPARSPSAPRALSKSEIGALRRAYEAGEPLRAIVERFGISKERVHKEMEAIGVARRVTRGPARHTLDEETVEEILSAYRIEGASISEICETFSINPTRLYTLLDREAGGERRLGGAEGTAVELEREWGALARELYENEVPIEKIAARLPNGVSEWTVYRLLNLQGLEPREAARRGRLDEESFHQELRRLYADPTITVAEIERKLDISKAARLRLQRKLGFQPRDANTRKRPE